MSKKPIVLLVTGEYPPYSAWGGSAYLLNYLARLLRREGYQVEVIAESDDGQEFTHTDDVGNLVHRVAAHRSQLLAGLRLVSPWMSKRVGSFKDLAFAMRVAEKAYELTHVWDRRLLWVETANWRAETFLLHLIPSLNRRILVRIVTPLEEVVRQNRKQRGLTIRATLLQEMLQQLLLRERLYSNAEYERYFRTLVRTSAAPIPPAREHTFLLPFDFARVRRRSPAPARDPDAPLRLLMIGRIEARKGFDVLCAALARLAADARRRLRIVAVGRDAPGEDGGTYRAELLARFPEIARESFEFVGAVSDGELQRHFDAADVGLVASTSESFGYNLVEVLAADLPVITSDVGAASELERRGVRYVGKYRSVEELVSILAALPDGLGRYAASGHSNREVLERMYRDNDRSYLEYVRSEIVPKAAGAGPVAAAPARPPARIESVDVVLVSTAGHDALARSLPAVQREAQAARAAGLRVAVTVVHDRDESPEVCAVASPDPGVPCPVRFLRASGPGPSRARNDAIQGSSADLVVFVDDSVAIEPGFVLAHVRSATSCPQAIGTTGRIIASGDGSRSPLREVGQIRPTGLVGTDYDSTDDRAVLVPLCPPGANMSCWRERMSALRGARWFDERSAGSALFAQAELGIDLFRRGEHFVHCPGAVARRLPAAAGATEKPEGRPERDGALLRAIHRGSAGLMGAALRAVAAGRAARDMLSGAREEAGAADLKGGQMISLLRRVQHRVYRVPGVGNVARTLVAVATLPRKLGELSERIERLEQAGRGVGDERIAVHVPAILNYVTSFAHTSRELTRKVRELEQAIAEAKAAAADEQVPRRQGAAGNPPPAKRHGSN